MDLKSLLHEIGKGASERVRADLEALASTPEARGVIERARAGAHEKRRALAKVLADLPKLYAVERKQRAAARLTAEKRLAAARIELAAATTDFGIASSSAAGLDIACESERSRIERELIDSADSRLSQLAEYCADMIGAVRHLGWSVEWKVRTDIDGKDVKASESNMDAVNATLLEIRRVSGEAVALKLVPMTFDDVTDRLRTLVLALSAKLAQFERNNLIVDEAGNLVLLELRTPAEATTES